MKKILGIFTITLISCTTKKLELNLAKPTNIAQVANYIKNKHYTVVRTALASPFKMDTLNKYDWDYDDKDTSSFYKNFRNKQLDLSFHFKNDTSVVFRNIEDNKLTDATYTLGITDPTKNEPTGIKLQIRYAGELTFGGNTTTSILTQTYVVTGIDEKGLVLETSYTFNERKVVVRLKSME